MKPLRFSIAFVMLSLALWSCTKNSSVVSYNYTKNNYTKNIGGNRMWHRYWHVITSYPGSTYVDTTYYYPDTSFVATAVNDSTVSIMGSNYVYERTDTANAIYYFGQAWEYFEYYNGVGLAYYFNKDSMAYVNGTAGHDGTSDYVYYTK